MGLENDPQLRTFLRHCHLDNGDLSLEKKEVLSLAKGYGMTMTCACLALQKNLNCTNDMLQLRPFLTVEVEVASGTAALPLPLQKATIHAFANHIKVYSFLLGPHPPRNLLLLRLGLSPTSSSHCHRRRHHQHPIPPPLVATTLNPDGKGAATMTQRDPMLMMIAESRRHHRRRTSR